MSRASLCLLPLLLVTLIGCGDKSPDNQKNASEVATSTTDLFAGLSGSLDIAGGTAHIPVMEKAARAIMTDHPAIRITVAGGGSGVGARKVGEGLVQIGNTGRPLSADEIETFGLVSHAFAVDGVCAVVHPDNGIQNLTSAQLQKAFSGQISNWKELGGADRQIHLFTRDEASGTRKVFWKKALAKNEVAPGANVVASNGAMKTAVAQDRDALGYVSVGHMDSTLKAPNLDGVAVTQENAANGVYPVTRKLYMNTKGEPTGLTAAFINYVQGPDAVPFIVESGYIPLVPVASAQ